MVLAEHILRPECIVMLMMIMRFVHMDSMIG